MRSRQIASTTPGARRWGDSGWRGQPWATSARVWGPSDSHTSHPLPSPPSRPSRLSHPSHGLERRALAAWAQRQVVAAHDCMPSRNTFYTPCSGYLTRTYQVCYSNRIKESATRVPPEGRTRCPRVWAGSPLTTPPTSVRPAWLRWEQEVAPRHRRGTMGSSTVGRGQGWCIER